MIRPLLAASAVTLCFAAPALAETRTYDVAPFTGIDASSGLDVTFETGQAQSVTVETQAGDFDDIEIDVRDDQLVLKRKQRGWFSGGWRKREGFSVMVTAPRLDRIEASSGADVTGRGLSGENVHVSVSSGAEADVTEIEAAQVVLESSSGSDLTASGTCGTLTAESSSGSDIEAGNLQCQSAKADASSGSDMDIYASETVQAEASSGADINVYGTPASSTVEESSGGSVSIKS